MTQAPARSTLHWLLAAVLAGAAPAAPVAQTTPPAPIRLPALGDIASEDLTIGAERHLGDQIMAELRRDPDFLDDPLLLDYVQSLWQPLLAASRERGNLGVDLDTAYAWEPFLVRDRAVNAFALPGGYIGVYLGMIALTGSRDELASVLAHEMSHVTQRHIARSIASQSHQSLVGLAAMILGVLATSRAGNGDATQAVIVGSQAAMVQGQLNFSREMEREADRIGWGVFQGAGFAPAGMASMFERLEQANRLDSGAFPYLRSHPLTVDRIGEARARVDATAGSRIAPPGTLEHQLMQARSRVLMEPAVQSLRRAQALGSAPLADGPDRLAALYGSTLASLELREVARAQATLDAALSLVRKIAPDDRRAAFVLNLVQARAWLAAGEPARALELLDRQANGSAPAGSRSLLAARAQATIDAAHAGAATPARLRASAEALQTWVADHRGDALAWSLLAQCTDRLGLKLRSMRAQAEAQAALGDLTGAIDRLRAGQRQARVAGAATDFVEASVIDARLRDLVAQRRFQLAQARGTRGGPDGARNDPDAPDRSGN
jgi:predicted Zn-dependent protease